METFKFVGANTLRVDKMRAATKFGSQLTNKKQKSVAIVDEEQIKKEKEAADKAKFKKALQV